MFEAGRSAPLREARAWLLLCGAVSVGGVLLALALQHFADMQPCAWCVLQRLIYLLIAVAAFAAAAVPGRPWRSPLIALGIAFCGAGVWAALYQHLVAARSDACGVSFAEKVVMALNLHEIAPWMFIAYAPCDQANLPMLGVPFAIWSLALFVLLAVALGLALRAGARAHRGMFG